MRKPEPWRLLHSIYAFSDRWLTLRHDTVRLPSGSTLAPYHVIEAADWVNVIAVSDSTSPCSFSTCSASSRTPFIPLPDTD